jgi:hypothetical protein
VAATWCQCGWTTTFKVDTRLPAHMCSLAKSFLFASIWSDHQRRQRPVCDRRRQQDNAPVFSNFAINGSAGARRCR